MVSNVSDSCLPGALRAKRVSLLWEERRDPLSASVSESKSVILTVFSITYVSFYGPWSPTVLRASFDGVRVSHNPVTCIYWWPRRSLPPVSFSAFPELTRLFPTCHLKMSRSGHVASVELVAAFKLGQLS